MTVSAITVQELLTSRSKGFGPLVIDVRKAPRYAEAPGTIPGAIRRDPDEIGGWACHLDLGRMIVVYCLHGHEVSQAAAVILDRCGYPARYLEGGIDAWKMAGAPLGAKPVAPSVWVTRARPKIDRIACPWLIRRFIDRDARFIYAPASEVLKVAADEGGTPYDIPGVAFSHVGEQCSFDAFIVKFGIRDEALLKLAHIVRGADTGRLELASQAPGLFAISLGLSSNVSDDHAMLRLGMVMYDALYAWLADLQDEVHGWPPAEAA
jgi:rhodanese-related sulfurtransferase